MTDGRTDRQTDGQARRTDGREWFYRTPSNHGTIIRTYYDSMVQLTSSIQNGKWKSCFNYHKWENAFHWFTVVTSQNYIPIADYSDMIYLIWAIVLLAKNWDFSIVCRGGSRDFEKEYAQCRPPWLADEENFRFQMA